MDEEADGRPELLSAAEAQISTLRDELAAARADAANAVALHRAATVEIDELRTQLAAAAASEPRDDERASLRLALSEARVRVADVEHELSMLQTALAAAEAARDAQLSEKESRLVQTHRMLDELKEARRRAEQLEADKRQLASVVAAARAAQQAADEAVEASRGAAASERERLAELEAQLGALHAAAAGVAAEGELHADALRRESDRLRAELADAMAATEARREEMAQLRAELAHRDAAHRVALAERDEQMRLAQAELYQQLTGERERAEQAARQCRLLDEKLRATQNQLSLRGASGSGGGGGGVGSSSSEAARSLVQRVSAALENKWVVALVVFIVPTLFWLLMRGRSGTLANPAQR